VLVAMFVLFVLPLVILVFMPPRTLLLTVLTPLMVLTLFVLSLLSDVTLTLFFLRRSPILLSYPASIRQLFS